MDSIMLCRAAYLLIYVDLAQRIGTPVARELRRAKVPTTLSDSPNSYVPVRQATQFVREVENREGINDFGLLAARQLTCEQLNPACAGLTASASTLYDLFRRFATVVRLENTDSHASMRREGNRVRITVHLLGDVDREELRYIEWLQAMVPIQLIRDVLGPAWSPVEITLRAHFDLTPEVQDAFPGTRIRVGCPFTSILVPAAIMSQTVRYDSSTNRIARPTAVEPQALSLQRPDFHESLRLVLRSYVSEPYLDIGFAAEIAGISVRSLQRRLIGSGLTYSHLVQQVRFEIATEMLADPGCRMKEIAYSVGYEDQAHFTRAFKRIAGISPSKYRRSQLDI